tara:strand:- start:2266 stop:2904 length:639 start_codon:yes stop_codon:yes gene_type:complete
MSRRNPHKDKRCGLIYKLTSPNNKSYIGQVVQFLKDGRKKGVRGRWLQHCGSARRNCKDGCVYLNRAIRKYKPENFTIEILIYCDIDKLDMYEKQFIDIYDTLTPNGYNLQEGGASGKHSKETCKKRSLSMKKMLKDPEKRLIWRNAKLGKRGKKRKCKNSCNQNLPKYIYSRTNGYVVEHPNGTGSFRKSRNTLDTNLKLAKEYLKSLPPI